jgi:hypothetical protein
MEYVDQQLAPFILQLRKFSRETFDALKSSLIQRYIVSNLVKNATEMMNRMLIQSDDDEALVYALLGYGSEVYHGSTHPLFETIPLEKTPDKEQVIKHIQPEAPRKQKEEPKKMKLVVEKTDTARRTQIFLNQIFPKQNIK